MVFYKHLSVSIEIKNGVYNCETYRNDIDDEPFDSFTIPSSVDVDDLEDYIKNYIEVNYLS
jgi:hypothetical protein